MNSQIVTKTIATLGTIRDIAIGMLPIIPREKRFGLTSISPDELTLAIAKHVPGARIEKIRLAADSKGTTDRGRLFLEWNQAGQDAALAGTAFAKGTPSTTSSRILNSAFGLCESEVRFYNELQPAVADLTLTPYVARVGAGGRFVVAMEDLGKEATFFQPGEEAPLSHAEAMMDVLARLHAQYWRSPRFDQDLRWITPYSRRPGFMLAHKVLVTYEKKWLRHKSDVPPAVQRLTRFYLENRPALDRAWEALPPTLCHGDPHLGNTYAKSDGTSGIYDWQNIHKMNGMRDVAYFMGHSLPIELRRAQEKNLIKRYLESLASHGVGSEVPSFDKAFDLYRLLIMDGWTSVWASLAIGGMAEEARGEIVLQRFCAALVDLDTEQALIDAV
jgi:aminoglycoside phosphotransferase (APT) family kinase protein